MPIRTAGFCAAAAIGAAQVVVSDEFAYVHNESYMGEDFFSRWTFWTEPDPTKGVVEFVDHVTAAASGLVNATSQRVYMGVDTTTMWTPLPNDGFISGLPAAGRRSVRIQSRATYNSGLFVLTLDHVPTGCGTWPAFWMYGEDDTHTWPTWGEYDIIESVHRRSKVMTTLHTTGTQCDQLHLREGEDFAGTWEMAPSGEFAGQCDVDAPGQWHNQGCSQYGPPGSTGELFNSGEGGTYAAEWDTVGGHIRTWFWPAGSEPSDLLRQTPDPTSWGKPYSLFTLKPSVCSSSHFMNMRLVFDLTFCGELGEPTFAAECPEFGRLNLTCREVVAQHPEAFREAFWSIRSLDVYQLERRKQASAPRADEVVWHTWMDLKVPPGITRGFTGKSSSNNSRSSSSKSSGGSSSRNSSSPGSSSTTIRHSRPNRTKSSLIGRPAVNPTASTTLGGKTSGSQSKSAKVTPPTTVEAHSHMLEAPGNMDSTTHVTPAMVVGTLPPLPTLPPPPTLPPLPPLPTLAPMPTMPPLQGLPGVLSGLAGRGTGIMSKSAVSLKDKGPPLHVRFVTMGLFSVAFLATLGALVAFFSVVWSRFRRRSPGFSRLEVQLDRRRELRQELSTSLEASGHETEVVRPLGQLLRTA